MLEILLISHFSKKIGEKAQERGRNPKGFKIATWVLWFVGEFLGAIVGGIILGVGYGIYLFALVGAAVGAAIAYLIVANCTPGDYVTAQINTQQTVPMLPAPCVITIVRRDIEPNFQPVNITLNKQFVGTIQNGQTINAQTLYWSNEIIVSVANTPLLRPVHFSLVPGQVPVIQINGEQINIAVCGGIQIIAQY